ncbi:Mitochondrial substrate carrier family protein L [Pseudocercospora fuligena]|uniref:Mitochondrial substrate carrier family protein L n=1 Tax=Pseudocercospora fuligena TaxID=685502 RepID=A0A8H6RUI7_9PEZI|nr:Mitochondrial substrate carrier family protein L [Pseudocercospora fuligena]
MSAKVSDVAASPTPADSAHGATQAVVSPSSSSKKGGNWKGFVAGVFSGITKLSVGHPFDTIKVRLQTSKHDQFKGPLDCLMQTLRKEGVNGIYKGATPPLIGWMCMDSLMLGSLTLYRRLLNENVFQPLRARPNHPAVYLPDEERKKLPAVGHGIAGMLAGWTVSFIAAPVEHVKARLQVQYQATKAERAYAGPIDCARKIYRGHGIPGLYHGLLATCIFRTFFFAWWGTYDIFTRWFQKNTSMSAPAVNFWAGGLSAQIFWLTSYPSDVVKQRIMTDPLEADKRKFPRWRNAAVAVYQESGWKGYWRGFVPCFLRAFPANAMALVAFEGVMRAVNKSDA